LCFDQGSKRIVLARGSQAWRKLPHGGIWAAWHRNPIYGTRAAQIVFVLVWLLSAASTIALYQSGSAFQSAVKLAGLSAALGGAAGNLADILRRRAILNFIHIGCWPAFNFADVSIIGGLALAFWP
jgi:lipoprotein signal peptidase